MLHQTYDGKYWYPADDLGPAIVGSPGAVAWGPDRLDVFVRGTDNQLWQMAYAGGTWTGSETQLTNKAGGTVHLLAGSADYQFV